MEKTPRHAIDLALERLRRRAAFPCRRVIRFAVAFRSRSRQRIADLRGGDKKRFSGHATGAMVGRYNHSVEEVVVLDITQRENET